MCHHSVMSTPTPSKLHQLSAPILLFIHGLPRIVFPLFTAALLLAGLFAPAVLGGILLLILALILWWLVALSWRLLTPTAKAMRTILLFVVVAYAIGRFTGRY
ncbi:MAG: hypothetical protein RIS75_421 [Actinomycetota bacterium]